MIRELARRGATAVEFAMCLPFVLLATGSLIDGGLYILETHAVVRAAHTGARVGASTAEPYPATGVLIVAAAEDAASASLVNSGFVSPEFAVDAHWFQDGQGTSWIEVEVSAMRTSMFGRFTPFDKDLHAAFSTLTQEQ